MERGRGRKKGKRKREGKGKGEGEEEGEGKWGRERWKEESLRKLGRTDGRT